MGKSGGKVVQFRREKWQQMQRQKQAKQTKLNNINQTMTNRPEMIRKILEQLTTDGRLTLSMKVEELKDDEVMKIFKKVMASAKEGKPLKEEIPLGDKSES